jgi:hypothetical protein
MDWQRHKMTLDKLIKQIKSENPSLKSGSEESGYTELNQDEYDAIILEWANNRLAKLQKKAEAETQAQAKAELLERLGITEDEAKLLLA